jgi:hypothetical protein
VSRPRVSPSRGIANRVRIVGAATREASVDVLGLAWCNEVLRLEEMRGQSFATPWPTAGHE